jgi:hypothetical protein
MRGMRLFQGRPIRRMRYGGRNVRYVADQLIIRLKPEYSRDRDAQEEVLSALPERSAIEDGFNDLGIALVNLPERSDLFEIVRELENKNVVAFAEPNFVDSAS